MEGSSQGTCIKDPWTKTTEGRIECGRWGVGRSGETNGGKMGTAVIEQQLKKKEKQEPLTCWHSSKPSGPHFTPVKVAKAG